MLTKREIACLSYGVLAGMLDCKVITEDKASYAISNRLREIGIRDDEFLDLMLEIQNYSVLLKNIMDERK